MGPVAAVALIGSKVVFTVAKVVGLVPLYERNVNQKKSRIQEVRNLIASGNLNEADKKLEELKLDYVSEVWTDIKTFFRGLWNQYIVKYRIAQFVTLVATLALIYYTFVLTVEYWTPVWVVTAILITFFMLKKALYAVPVTKSILDSITNSFKRGFKKFGDKVHEIVDEQDRLDHEMKQSATPKEGIIESLSHKINSLLEEVTNQLLKLLGITQKT